MFNLRNKKEKELDEKLKQIEIAKQELEQAKEELLRIKEMMENTNDPDYIDISNVYVMLEKGIKHLVRQEVEKITVHLEVADEMVDGYKSTVIDIFNDKVLYTKESIYKIGNRERVEDSENGYYIFFSSIFKEEPNLLAYVDKRAPRYILQHFYYKLNNIDVNKFPFQKQI